MRRRSSYKVLFVTEKRYALWKLYVYPKNHGVSYPFAYSNTCEMKNLCLRIIVKLKVNVCFGL